MTVTSKLHTQEYRDTELNIVIDEIGPGEGRLDSGGIEIPLKPAGKGGVAQFPAGSPAQATTCGQSAPVTEVACEEEDWERVTRSPPPDRSGGRTQGERRWVLLKRPRGDIDELGEEQ